MAAVAVDAPGLTYVYGRQSCDTRAVEGGGIDIGNAEYAGGAAALIADYNGVERASHVRDKLAEMTHLNETVYGAGMAASHEAQPTPAGNYEPDGLLANVCKHNVTR